MQPVISNRISKYRWIASAKAAVSVLIVCLFLVLSLPLLHGTEADEISRNEAAISDTLKAKMLRDYHFYRVKSPMRSMSFNWLNEDFELALQDRTRTITESELYEVSMELYSTYYLKRIELYNLNDTAFLYLNLKDAMNSNGALQFRVNLPDLDELLKKKQINKG
jgi:hypothetical protein